MAARHLPSADLFYRFFGDADEEANVAAYWRFLAPRLDAESRAYWERRGFGLRRRRISLFSRNVYRHGLPGGSLVSRTCWRGFMATRATCAARSLGEQRSYFDNVLAPLFDKRLIRWLTSRKISLYGLGIPVAQYHALAGDSHMTDVLRQRVSGSLAASVSTTIISRGRRLGAATRKAAQVRCRLICALQILMRSASARIASR